MPIRRILNRVTDAPLLIHPAKIGVIADALAGRMPITINGDIPALASPTLQTAGRDDARPAADKIRVLGITGTLVNRAMPGDSGMATYRDITAAVRKTIADPAVGGLVLDIDSLGGEAAGCQRCAEVISDAAAVMPVFAFVDTSACSAAYYLASAAGEIWLADNAAMVGSIGCVAMHRDQSKKDEQDGITYTFIYAGARKIDYSPHRPLADDVRERVQRAVNTERDRFAAFVAAARGLSVDDVLATEAGIYEGQAGVARGLADRIGPWDEMLAELKKQINGGLPATAKGAAMTTKERLNAIISKNEDAAPALAELGWLSVEDHQAAVAAAAGEQTKEAAKDAAARTLEEITGVLAAAAAMDAPASDALSLVREGITSAEEAGKRLQQLKAERDAAASAAINSTITTATGSGEHPLLAAVKKGA